MSISDQIYEEVKKLPKPLQVEVLGFVQSLASGVEREIASEHEHAWAEVSVSLAMRGMEDEDTPSYSIKDLKESFS